MVRFQAAAGDRRFDAVGHGLRQHIFQFANLVAAESGAGVIVAFDEDAQGSAAQGLTESRRFFDRRRKDAVIRCGIALKRAVARSILDCSIVIAIFRDHTTAIMDLHGCDGLA